MSTQDVLPPVQCSVSPAPHPASRHRERTGSQLQLGSLRPSATLLGWSWANTGALTQLLFTHEGIWWRLGKS